MSATLELRETQERDAGPAVELEGFLHEEELDDAPPAASATAELDAWIDRRLAVLCALARQVRQNADVAQRRIDMIVSWRDDENAALVRRAEHLTRQLEQVARGYPYPKNRKSRVLPCGKIGLKDGLASLEIVDKNAALEWAKVNLREKVKVTLSIGATPLKEWTESTGTVPPGCEYHEKELDRPYVSPAAEA